MAYLAKLEKDVCIYADHPLIWIKRWGFEKHRKCGYDISYDYVNNSPYASNAFSNITFSFMMVVF